jgi:carbon-monoxide dehydrogenase medium subunit
VKPARFTYLRPETLEQAVAAKAEHGVDAAFLAGGQSLIPMLNFRLARPAVVIDLGAVLELDYTFLDGDRVVIGATRSQRDVELDREVKNRCPLVPQALGWVAHPAIRNRGTVVGSVAHADSASELPAVLLALDASVRAVSASGERSISADEFFVFNLTTALRPDELLAAVELPQLPKNTGTAFVEVARRHGDYALAGVCAAVRHGADGAIEDVRLACCGIAPVPVRATAAESILRGSPPSEDGFEHAADLTAELVDAIDEEQCSVLYRRRLVRTLVLRALSHATPTPDARA